MLFDRYRKAKRPDDAVRPVPAKPSNLAAALFRALTKKAWYTEKQRQDSGVDLTPPPAPPRQSASLPNIASYDVSNVEMTTTPPTPSSPSLPVLESPTPKPTVSTPAPRSRAPLTPDFSHSRAASKRHSAEHRVTATMDDQRMKRVKRHSFTYGRIHDDLGRLKVSDDSSTSATTVGVAPKRSQSQQLPVNRLQPRVHGRQQQQQQQGGTPLSAERLAEMLAMDPESMLLIDVRNILEYQRRRIDGSFNVNLPSLLIKRYQRGTVSNFNLENFITTTEGRARYVEKRGGNNNNRKLTWVVYDDDMLLERTSQAWTLLGVLERAMNNDNVFYLQGGFNGFQAHDTYLVEGCSDDDMDNDGNQDVDTVLLDDSNNNSNRKSLQFPRRSVSYTLGSTHDKTHLHRRTSFSALILKLLVQTMQTRWRVEPTKEQLHPAATAFTMISLPTAIITTCYYLHHNSYW